MERLSTTITNQESIDDINLWLSLFRRDELESLSISKIHDNKTKIVIECDDSERLKIVGSNPPDRSYLSTSKTVPHIDVVFSEPIDEDSLTNIRYNGNVISQSGLSLHNNNYRLRILTSFIGSFNQGNRFHIFTFEDVKSIDGRYSLSNKEILQFSTSYEGGTRGGVEKEDPDKRGLVLSKIENEFQNSEKALLEEFIKTSGLRKADIVKTVFITGFPEHKRSTLYILHTQRVIVPYVVNVSPSDRSCFYSGDITTQVTVTIQFNVPVNSDDLENNILFDFAVVSTYTVSDDGKYVRFNYTPSANKHHCVMLTNLAYLDYVRSWPYFWSFVIHERPTSDSSSGSLPSPVTSGDMPYYGTSDWDVINANTSEIELYLQQSDSGEPEWGYLNADRITSGWVQAHYIYKQENHSPISGNHTLDADRYNCFRFKLDGNLTIDSIRGGHPGQEITLEIYQTPPGGYTFTLPPDIMYTAEFPAYSNTLTPSNMTTGCDIVRLRISIPNIKWHLIDVIHAL